MYLTWIDEYLIWNPRDYGGLDYLTVKGDEVWTPDFRILNKKVDSAVLKDGMTEETFKVLANGTVGFILTGELKTRCDVDPEKFPVDCHECEVIMAVSLFNNHQVLKWDGERSFIHFDVVKDAHALWSMERVYVIQAHRTLIMKLVLKRLPEYYLYNIVFPASSLSLLSMFTFFIPINGGERVSFGMTIYLTFMVLMLQVSSLLPVNSQNISTIGKYFLQLISSSLVAIFNSVVMSYFGNASMMPRNGRIQPHLLPLDTIANGDFKDLVCFETRKNDMNNEADDKCQNPQENKNINKMASYNGRRRNCNLLRVFDWVTLAVCFLVSAEAHIELYLVINQETCPSVQEQ
ncbi:neuronal acetylcholine receptor subunit alpha-9-like [Mytilus galloprovincialis]|uniref:neuronal acetylcholine receptor subunit alpha-9-like n=1 Tax=Mytilus galloprovincialis TaxID=29158 RepID=UPI003F7C7F59